MSLSVTVVMLLTSVCLSSLTAEFPIKDCDSIGMEFLIILDCRQEINQQIDRFARVAVEYLRTNRNWGNFPVSYMTNTVNGLVLHKNVNYKSLKSSAENLKTNCSKEVWIENIFEITRTFFTPKTNTMQISFVMLGQNISATKTDRSAVLDITEKQDREPEVKRFFVIVAPDKRDFVTRKYILYSDTFKATNLFDFFLAVCEAKCMQDSIDYSAHKPYRSFYHIARSNGSDADKSERYCQKNYDSYLISLETYDELKFFKEKFYEEKSSGHQKEMTFLIGLKVRLDSNEFRWASKSPFVLGTQPTTGDVNLSPKEMCVYLKFTSNHQGPVQDSPPNFELQTFNCSNGSKIDYVACECHILQSTEIKYEYSSFTRTKTPSDSFLPSGSFLYALQTLFFQMSVQGNQTRFTAPHTSIEVRIFQCNISDIATKEFLSHHICQYENQTLVQNNSSALFDSKHTKIEVTNYTKLLQYIKYSSRYEHGDISNNETEDFNSTNFIKCDGRFVPVCIYAKYADNYPIFGCTNNSQLQGCENFTCTTGYFKCPKSYCIPIYQVNDGVHDCPMREDEEVIFQMEHPLCTGQMLLEVYEMCFETDLWKKLHTELAPGYGFPKGAADIKYKCKTPCHTNLTCFSSVVNLNTTSSATNMKYIHISSQFFRVLNLILPHPRIVYILSFFKVLDLRISGCGIANFDLEFQNFDISDLVVLDLSNNQVTNSKTLDSIAQLQQLRFLNLSHNQNLRFDEHFQIPENLMVVDLSYTSLQFLPHNMFQNLTSLRHLNLGYTKIRCFEHFGMPDYFKLNSLDIRGMELENIKANYFRNLIIEDTLLASDYRLCCPVILAHKIHSGKCHAPSDAISTCQHLVGDTLKRVIIWIVGFITIFGNGFVLVYRLLWNSNDKKKTHILFIIGLAVSDFIMGVYLIIIASADIYFTNEYVVKESSWRNGKLCHFSGFLSTLSSETSTFFICLITCDRYIIMRYPFNEYRMTLKQKYASFISSWILGFLLALIPAVHPDWEIYSSNGMCLALPLSTGAFKGWGYSFAIFVVFNFLLFLYIAVGQIAIFFTIINTRRRLTCTRHSGTDNNQEEITLAKKLAMVALSDFLCWFPIGIMGMLSVGGHRYSPDVYAWVAIFILPVNSAVNPMLYTIPTIYNRLTVISNPPSHKGMSFKRSQEN
ncbi:hypothetical protein Btru_078105 [Bulinus truncatus]|nr:hypothetical protein Btru_078105 [Bulinus truncatus]